MKHIKIIGGVILGLFLIIAGVFWFLRITDVTVEGGEIYSEQEIISSAMSDKYDYHTLYFLAKSKLGRVSCLPFVQEIDVEWKSPSAVVLHVYDKTISGCVKYMGQYIYFDKDGVVLQSLAEPMDGVPVVTGIKFGKFTLNEAFEVKDSSLFETIMNLSRLIRHYKVQVDQIKFDGKNVTLYSGKVEVYLGQKDFYDDDMAALASVLKKTNKKGLAGTIDMENFNSGDRIILKTTGEDVDASSDTGTVEPSGEAGTSPDEGSADDVSGTDSTVSDDSTDADQQVEQ
ncbi:MAG: hypothetical protein BHW06_05120 [Clostridium sp. 44_14]|nr:MAG: hypothetical protein BHW06_05120 [Clostridium sp. 44_14]